MEPELIKECVREVLSERASISSDVHRDHHSFLSEHIPLLKEYLEFQNAEMALRKQKRKNWEKIRDAAVGTTVVAIVTAALGVLAWIGSTIIHAVMQIINNQPVG